MLRSPPSRRRGLKFWYIKTHKPHRLSPPSRRRGLKLKARPTRGRMPLVASFAEAWIEIGTVWSLASVVTSSPPSRRRGLKLYSSYVWITFRSRLLRGGVD